MASPSPRAVLLFGSSANPPTGLGGHAGIVRWAATEAEIPPEAPGAIAMRPDEVWVLPVYQHPFSDKRDMPPYEDRRAMAKLAFERLPGLEGRVRVVDAERDLAEEARAKGIEPAPVRVGTIDIVKKLRQDHPQTRFALLLGGDTYRDVLAGRWKESQTLLREVPIVVVERVGVQSAFGLGVRVSGLTRASSTEARGSADVTELGRILQPEVLSYIMAHRLYSFARS